MDQILTTSLMIRYGAHLGLFFVVGFVTTFVGMVIFRGYYRIFGVVGAGIICHVLAYYPEDSQQTAERRPSQPPDAVL